MRKIRYVVLLIISLFLLLHPLDSYSGKEIKTIVVFLPFNASLPSLQNLLEGFRGEISDKYDQPYNLLIEYFDIVRLQDEAYIKDIINLYNEKVKDTKIDLLVISGPFTYAYLQKFGFTALRNTPTIRIEFDPPLEPQIPSYPNNNTLEIKLNFQINKTFKQAFNLFPDYKEVYILSGNSGTDQYFTSLVKNDVKDFMTHHHIVYISGITLDSTIHIARSIPAKSIVFIPIYLSDKKNIPFSTPEAIGIIANNCNAPVFPIFDSFIKTKGGIGGYVFSYVSLGRETGRIAIEMLNGRQAKDITVNNSVFYQNVYDWRQLKKWNLTRSGAIPANSIFYYKDADFIADHKWQILFVLIILISETLLMGYLYILNKRQKETVRQKTETENLLHDLIREDRLSTMVELTASLSHELNQPLTAILYSAQAGKRFIDSGNLNPELAKEIFENIIEDDKRAGGLISSVRSLMKLEIREKEKIELNTLIQDTIRIFNSDVIRQRIQLRQKLRDEPVYVHGDKIQIQQVILNLLTNAASAMEATDPDKKVLEITEWLDKGSVIVSVNDSGPGISDDLREKIFKPFVTTRKSGFGIGLAVCKSIIERHNGTIWVINSPGGGAKFSFRLQVNKKDV